MCPSQIVFVTLTTLGYTVHFSHPVCRLQHSYATSARNGDRLSHTMLNNIIYLAVNLVRLCIRNRRIVLVGVTNTWVERVVEM